MAEQDELQDAMEENLLGPKKVTGDTGSVEQHSISDQLAALKYKAGKAAASKGFGGIRFYKFIPPGQD